MKNIRWGTLVRCSGCLLIIAAALIIAEKSLWAQKNTGDLWLSGTASINGTAASSGAAIFSGSKIKTGQGSSATINLGKLGRIKLESDSELALQFSPDQIGGNQLSGVSAVSANKGIRTKITTPHVLVESDGAALGLVSIEVRRDYTCVIANRGTARLTAGAKVFPLSVGQALSFDVKGVETNGHCEGLKSSRFSQSLVGLGAATAAGLIPLTRAGIDATRGAQVTPTPVDTATNQSARAPQATASTNPTTPVIPPAPFDLCGCKFDREGKPLAGGKTIFICHVNANGRRETLTAMCMDVPGHFNLNGTPRAGHSQDICGACQP